MDYYSVLGPIDPQILNRDGRWVPGIGYLEKYNALIKRSKDDQEPLSLAEMEYMIRKFDPAELFAIEQAKNHSVELIQKWLCQCKFKDWTARSNGTPVDDEDRRKRAKEIADLLSDPTEWYSHGRGIPMRVLTSDRINLKINDFAEDSNLNTAIREYYDLIMDYCQRIGASITIHTANKLTALGE